MASPEPNNESKNSIKMNTDYTSSKFQPDSCVLGGKSATGYEDFVHKLFAAGERARPTDPSSILNYYFPTSILPNASLPASMQLKLEGLHDNDVLLGGSNFNQGYTASSNRTIGVQDLGKYGREAVYGYTGRFRSDESIKQRNDLKLYEQKRITPLRYKTNYRQSSVKNHSNDLPSLPASEFLFSDNDAYQKRSTRDDTRIVGSNFVMAASRPDDLFLRKIDKVLTEARNVNSWNA